MSQQKVDRYKEEKKNREKTMKRNKVKKVLIAFLVALIIGAAIGIPLGRWIYNYQQTHQKKEDIFISSHEYEDWFNQYWVDKYASLYTGSELATDQPSTESGTEGEGSGTEADTTATGTETVTTEVPAQSLTEASKDKE